MDIKEAIRCIIDGEAILFTGSGFSAAAIKQDGEKMCTAKKLAHKLLHECGFEEIDYVDDLGQASEIYKSEIGSLQLLDFIKREFTAATISEEQKYLATLPWFRIYTTNYDNVLEKAWLDCGKKLNISVLSDRQTEIQDKRTLCVCLNGSLSRISEDKLNDEIKLTNSSYLTESFKSSPWLSFFQTDLKTAKAVFFIGYSMQYDLDIQRIVFENKELREKTFFIMWEKEPKANIISVKRFGTPCPIGMNSFMNMVKTMQKSYFSVKKFSYPLLCFDKVIVSKIIPEITDKEAFNLFIKGNIGTWDQIYYSLASPDLIQYCIYRSKLNEVLEKIKNGDRNILVHSSLGNGKTLFLMSLATLLFRQGYTVYYFQKYRSTISRELEQICNEGGTSVVIFDKYSDCVPYLEMFKSFRQDQVLIVSDRSAMNDITYGKIESLFGDFTIEDLNQLDDNEIEQFSSILSRYALWGDKSHYTLEKKTQFVTQTCKRSMAKTILQLLHSPSIIERYKYLADNFRNNKGYYGSIIYILIGQVAGFKVDTDDLVNLFDATKLNSPDFRNNTSVREFIDFSGNRVKVSSSLFAQVLLEEIFDTGVIVDLMIDIYKRLNEQKSRRDVRLVLKKMMTFSNLQHILNKKDKNYKANLLHYYDSIHTLSFCAENPHFWMQYAILKLSEYDYITANIYFNTAYSYANKDSDFDTYQIDNHHARFILENEVVYGSQVSCMEAFKEAHSVLMNPKHKEDSYYYPYRVAQKYYPFYERFFEGMTVNEKIYFITCCGEMLKRIEWYLSYTTSLEGRRDVLRAQDLLGRIIAGK